MLWGPAAILCVILALAIQSLWRDGRAPIVVALVFLLAAVCAARACYCEQWARDRKVG